MSSIDTYSRADVVDSYLEDTTLQAPEQTIFDLLNERLPNMAMLDIGVGGGRTTEHFGKVAQKYTAIDYSENMVQVCKDRYADNPELSFEVCDVRALDIFENDTFDFILFSFNGIDYISHEDRLKAFQEMHRVGKPGCIFYFSSHNLLSLKDIFKLRNNLSTRPKTLARNLIHWCKLKFIHNRGVDIDNLLQSPYAVFNDGAHDFELQTYYIKPKEQIKQLTDSNLFGNVSVYSLISGLEYTQESELNSATDSWLYYLCSKN